MSDRLTVKTNTTLLPFLFDALQGWSRSTVKQRLKSGCVHVNGEPITHHNFELLVSDQVNIEAAPRGPSKSRPQIDILYEDHDLVAINKPAGLLSVGSGEDSDPHALGILRAQLGRHNHAIKLWPVNRIDRDTSGVMLFALSKEMREAVMDEWDTVEKTYLAIVEGRPEPEQGTVDQPLRLDPEIYQMHVGPHPDAKDAVTHFTTERSVGRRTLLKVNLETGLQHQIRAHLAWLGHPVVGDQRYGTAGEKMGLHALQLSMVKPGSSKPLTFETPAPSEFWALLGPGE
jgi:23S rRNA pseudouridine1911/1915/1917 synthase